MPRSWHPYDQVGQTLTVIELRAGDATCSISPLDGGRLASLRVGSQQLIVERLPHAQGQADALEWGSYPMAPWAGRVSSGRFDFAGTTYSLPINLAPHAIHGTVFTKAWLAHDITPTSVRLSCGLGPAWPLGGTAHQYIELRPDRLICGLAIVAADKAMPCVLGWHPWFVKPDVATIRFQTMYQRDEHGIPTGALVAPTAGPWDDCFKDPVEPIELLYRDHAGIALVVTVLSDCTHWVVYDLPGHATCIEPQSGPPDAFNIRPNSLESHTLQPHESIRRAMIIRWRDQRVPLPPLDNV